MSSNPRLENDKVEHLHKVSETVHDPVCGMVVDPQAGLRELHAGPTYLFCSAHCQAKFREDPERYIAASELKDPVCGMSVEADSELREVHAGATYVFCGAHCQAKFRQDPGQYVGDGGAAVADASARAAAPPVAGATYIFTMYPDVCNYEPFK